MKNQQFYGALPTILSKEDLQLSLEKYKEIKQKEISIDMDKALMIFRMALTRYGYSKNNNLLNYKRLVEIPRNDFVLLIGNDYCFYVDALVHAGYIETDNQYIIGKKCIAYKVADYLCPNVKNNYRLLPLASNAANKRAKLYKERINQKIDLKINGNPTNLHKKMIKDVYELINDVDIDAFFDENINSEHEKERQLIADTYTRVYNMKNHDAGIKNNHCDNFGHRFHSIFTNTTSKLRPYIKFGNEKGVSIDIRNSQFAVLSIILKNIPVVKKLVENSLAKSLIKSVEEVKKSNNFSQERWDYFLDISLSGELYDIMANHAGITRAEAKSHAFAVFFSTKKQNGHIRKKYATLFPEFIHLCNLMNKNGDDISKMPKLCQLAESNLMIFRVCKKFWDMKKYPAITIHDSILCHPEDVSLFQACFNQVFIDLDLQPLLTKVEFF